MARLIKILWLLSWVLSSSLFLSHWLILEKVSCYIVRCPLERFMGQGRPLADRQQGTEAVAQQPLRNWMLKIIRKYRSRSSSLLPLLLLSHLIRPQTKQVAWQQLQNRPWALDVPWFLTHRNCEIVNIYCFMLLNLGISYYAAITNQPSSVLWILLTCFSFSTSSNLLYLPSPSNKQLPMEKRFKTKETFNSNFPSSYSYIPPLLFRAKLVDYLHSISLPLIPFPSLSFHLPPVHSLAVQSLAPRK